MKLKKIIRPSIFTKLILFLFVIWLGANLLQFFVFRQVIITPNLLPIHRVICGYMDSLIRDLGNPPSFEKALDFSRQMGIDIKYDSPEHTWATEPEAFNNFEHFNPVKERIPGFDTRLGLGRVFVSKKVDYGRFIIAIQIRAISDNVEKRLILYSLFLLSFILSSVYFSIRWIIKPVKLLSQGAEEIGKGNLEYKIPLQRSDELGDLVRTFNSMTGRIRDQIRAKEQLLLDVSHELRSPITRMKVALELLPENENWQKLNDDLHEMEIMIAELLETARLERNKESLTLVQIHVNKLLEEINQIYGYQALDLKIISKDESNIILGDIRQIKTVLTNILDNAFKYSGENAKQIEIEEKRVNDRLVIKVKDHGPGIPEEDIPFIFEPFYRVDKSRSKKTGGYGLGLSLCKKIMEAHDGDITIESEPGEGTTVLLSFPVLKL